MILYSHCADRPRVTVLTSLVLPDQNASVVVLKREAKH